MSMNGQYNKNLIDTFILDLVVFFIIYLSICDLSPPPSTYFFIK